jgi:hypothetical protein
LRSGAKNAAHTTHDPKLAKARANAGIFKTS